MTYALPIVALMLSLQSRLVLGVNHFRTKRGPLFPFLQLSSFRGGDNNNRQQPLPLPGYTRSRSPTMADLVLPEREYGYRETPLMWDELVSIICKEQNLAKLSRSVPQQTEYELYMRQLKKEWKSVYDFILHSKFGYERRQVKGLWEAIPPSVKEIKTILVLNDFPYYNAPGIFHYVLWKIGADVTQEEIVQAKQELRESLGDVLDVLHWINPPHLKSLPDIDHVHILCHRNRKDTHTSILEKGNTAPSPHHSAL